MALDAISDLWVPAVWTAGIREAMLKRASLLTSRAVITSPTLAAFLAGPGQTINIPHWKDLTDQANAIQAENSATSTQVIGGNKQVAVALNRRTGNGIEALAAMHTGNTAESALENLFGAIADRQAKQAQTSLVYALRGFCTTAAAAIVNNIAHEDTDDTVDSANYIDGDTIIDAAALLGENSDVLEGGVIMLHPVIEAALRKQDSNAFVQASIDGGILLPTYRGMQIVRSSALTRAGTGSPATTVYETYIMSPGSIAYAAKPQSNRIGDTAALLMEGDASKNNQSLYDYTRFGVHPNGAKWVGTPSGESPTNAELATAGNWNLAFQTASRCGFAQILTNG